MSRTADDLRRKAAELQAKADAAIAAGKIDDFDVYQRRAWALSDLADEREKMVERAKVKGLPAGHSARTIHDMNIDTRAFSANVKRGVGRSRRKHPAQLRLYKAGVTIAAVSKEIGETRARVTSWMAPDEPRAIPRHQADYLQKKYGIPLSAWARIAD